jgi:hypothetical protein
VETVGNAPTATILQGSSAPLCCPRGAEGWFRANLPASSARCFHQISFLGELERPGRIELLVGALATLCSTIELQPHGGKWTESNLLPAGTAFTARRRHQPVLMALPIIWLRAPGLHRAIAAHETAWVPNRPTRQKMVRRLSTPSLAAGTSAVSREMADA